MRRKTVPAILLLSAITATAFSGCAGRSITSHPTPAAKPHTAAPAVKPHTAAPAAKPTTPAPAAKPTTDAPASKPTTDAPASKPNTDAPASKPTTDAPASKPTEISVSDKLFAEGMTALQGGGHEPALELFAAAWKEKPGHEGVAAEFDGALLALKKNGDAAYAQGKWEDAGKRWMGTLRFIGHPAANWRGYPFTRSEVRAKVDHLSAALMEKALTEYRRGGVSSAIADWKTILSYDPGHEEAAKSLKTASTQLEKLKKLPPAPHPRTK